MYMFVCVCERECVCVFVCVFFRRCYICAHSSESALHSFFLFFSSSGAVIKALTAASELCESAPNSQLTFSLFPFFFSPFSGAAIEALTAAIQLCESAPNSSKAVKRSAECHELLSICFQQVRFTCFTSRVNPAAQSVTNCGESAASTYFTCFTST